MKNDKLSKIFEPEFEGVSLKLLAGILLLIPAVCMALFFFLLAIDSSGCGSEQPGLCFTLGTLTMIFLPLSIFTTPVGIILVILGLIKTTANKNSSATEKPTHKDTSHE